MNNKTAILLPLLIALAFACGMWVQRAFQKSATPFLNPVPSKMESVMQLIKKEYVEDVNIDSLCGEMLPALFEKLDPHSVYISAEEYRDMTDPIRGSFEGIGVQFNIQNDTIVIVQVIHGGPSEKLNIKAGDKIITVNDSLVAGVGMTNEKTIKLLKGPSGTKVTVGIKRFGTQKIIPFEITRGAVPITSIDASYMLDNQTGYIAINCFSQNTHDEFLSAVSLLKSKNMKNLVVDLRENGGGLLFAAISLAEEFLREGDTIVFTKGRNEPAEYFVAEGSGTCGDLNLVVLINEYSASASEIFAGAMQDNGRGTIVGRRSYGKGVVNEDFPLRDSSVVRLTTKKFYTPCGRCIQKPYNGSLNDYDHELVNRYNHGEMRAADSISFPDSLKFVTKTGKIVYGGGGIMPDVFVPMDTTLMSNAYKRITAEGHIYNFACAFAENNRNRLQSLSTEEAYQYCRNNISCKKITDSETKKLLTECYPDEVERLDKLMCYYIIRNIFGNTAFFELYNADDTTIQKALEILSTQN